MLDHNNDSQIEWYNKQAPPHGGANLECLLGFHNLSLRAIEAVFNEDFCSKIDLNNGNAFVVLDDGIPVAVPDAISFCDFFQWLQRSQYSTFFINTVVGFQGLKVPLSFGFYLHLRVIQLAVPEDMLWRFKRDPRNAAFDMLKSFFNICAHVCAIMPPFVAIIGSEPISPDEFATLNESRQNVFAFNSSTFFSETHQREVFKWYTDIYIPRWERGQHLD